MIFKKLIIILIAIICISSGAFAIFSSQPLENTITDNNDIHLNEINNISSSESLNDFVNDFEDYWQYSYGHVINVDGELRHYLNDKGLYYLESEGLADRYVQCVECGGYIPIGPINNPLPKAAICHHDTSEAQSKFSEYSKYSVSRDEAYNTWVERGMPVFDDEHLLISQMDNLSNSDDYKFLAVYCKDCDGFVQLKDYSNDIVKFMRYFTKGNYVLINVFSTSEPYKSCSHYTGTLDILNAPVEDFHSGWFKSINDYNDWLTWIQDVNEILKEKSNNQDSETISHAIDVKNNSDDASVVSYVPGVVDMLIDDNVGHASDNTSDVSYVPHDFVPGVVDMPEDI
ncbi:MAG: hypothetical protein IJQ68_08575 [Methanobrevibacter sp.]|uniref:hypothetical protein n=1 Tax=Methanobrevibacter sp. TaxID=66852 RepID=UPI0025FF3FF2|nr:hypothetical protein [Methanobrevibacter sp.]MBR0272021.1 hypothetical protein [Methanobrevibacter sp.]